MFTEISSTLANNGRVLFRDKTVFYRFNLLLKGRSQPCELFSDINLIDTDNEDYTGFITNEKGEMFLARYNGDIVSAVSCDVDADECSILSGMASYDVLYKNDSNGEIMFINFVYTWLKPDTKIITIITYNDTDNGIVVNEHSIDIGHGRDTAFSMVSELNLDDDEKDVINRYIEFTDVTIPK